MMKYLLRDNNYIPYIGYGTWKLPNTEETIEIVKNAIECGYTMIDTASAYGNEVFIGKGIKQSKINRKELFISGKLWNEDREYDKVIAACKKTISNLDCEYLDLYLVHWPASPAVHLDWEKINNEVWRAMEYLYKEGLVKAIGVCNFKVNQLEALISKSEIIPMVNQIEFHPGFMQKEIVDFCKKNNILIEAWSPLGSGKMLKKKELIELSDKYGVSPAQLCIKWCLQNEVIPVPKTKSMERMKENLNIDELVINDKDMEYINNLPYLGGSGLDSETITLFK